MAIGCDCIKDCIIQRTTFSAFSLPVFYRWSNCVEGFNMPLKIYNDKGNLIFIRPSSEFKMVPKDVKNIKVDENFYIDVHSI